LYIEEKLEQDDGEDRLQILETTKEEKLVQHI